MDFESLVGRINQVQDVLQENDLECIWQGSFSTGEYCKPIDGIPGRMNASVEFYLNDLYYNLKMLGEEQHQEKDVYFYHSDLLRKSSAEPNLFELCRDAAKCAKQPPRQCHQETPRPVTSPPSAEIHKSVEIIY